MEGPAVDQEGGRGAVWRHLSSKFGELINLELTSFPHKWSSYGGAYELFTAKKGGRGFTRLNYALTEFSNRLHVEQQWSDFMEIARLIQLVGKSDRSVCFVGLFSLAGTFQIKRFEICDIMQDQVSGSIQIDPSDLNPALSFAYVIGTGFSFSFEPDTHYAYFALNQTKDGLNVRTNPGECERMVQKYYGHGFGIVPGSSGFDPWADQET